VGSVEIAREMVSCEGEINPVEFILQSREVYWHNVGRNEGDGCPALISARVVKQFYFHLPVSFYLMSSRCDVRY
jgi:hypothetical protein